MNSLFRSYHKLLLNFPVGVQAVQTGLLMGSSDIIAQVLVEKRNFKTFDVNRALKFTLIGTCFVGPPLRIWYGVLEKYIGNKGKMSAVKKVAVDQLIFAPSFMVFFMTIVGLSQGSTLNELFERLKHDFSDVMINNYKLWPAVQLCNFYLVPLQFQVVTVQVVAIIWNTYLSWKMNRTASTRSIAV